MMLTYLFRGTQNAEASASTHIGNGWYEPHYEEVELEEYFDYYVEPKQEDYVAFIMWRVIRVDPMADKEYIRGCASAIERCIESELIQTDAIEDDPRFAKMVKDIYEEDAYEAFREEYGCID